MSFVASYGDMYAGEAVVLKELNQSELNGLRGHLMAYDKDSSRWCVRVATSPTSVIRAKIRNLEVDQEYCETRNLTKEAYVSFLRINRQRLMDKIKEGLKCQKLLRSRPSNCRYGFCDSRDVRTAFPRLQKLWAKYGEKYTNRIHTLPIGQAMFEVSDDKLYYVITTDAAGSWTSKHVPIPTGVSPDDLCLVPELHTRGPSFKGLAEDQVIVLTNSASK